MKIESALLFIVIIVLKVMNAWHANTDIIYKHLITQLITIVHLMFLLVKIVPLDSIPICVRCVRLAIWLALTMVARLIQVLLVLEDHRVV